MELHIYFFDDIMELVQGETRKADQLKSFAKDASLVLRIVYSQSLTLTFGFRPPVRVKQTEIVRHSQSMEIS